MKRRILFLLVAALMVLPLFTVSAETTTVWREYYVSQNGSDSGDGLSKGTAFATIERAQQAVRDCAEDMHGDIIVHILKGNYYLDDTLRFYGSDSGRNGYRVIYRGEDMPLVSAGVSVTGFRKSELGNGLYEADVSDLGLDHIRELYVNGRKKYPASSNRLVMAVENYDDPNTSYNTDGLIVNKSDMGLYENADDIELQWLVNWKYSTANVEKIEQNPQNRDQVIVRMKQSWWNIVGGSERSAYAPSADRRFTVSNAFELLDLPGEFYYNRKTKKIYYLPEEGEDMESAEVHAPRLDRLMFVNGSDEDRVKNITFEGIEFAHTAFNAPTIDGVFPVQAQSVNTASDLLRRMPCGIEINRSDGLLFEGNYFFGFGAGAVAMVNGVQNTTIRGNAFSDIGDAAVVQGWIHQNERDAPPTGESQLPPEGAVYNLVSGLVNGDIQLSSSYHGRVGVGSIAALGGGGEPYVNPETLNAYPLIIKNEGLLTDQSWMGDPDAAKRGEKQWIKYDFQDYYNISHIRLRFDTQTIPTEERDGFEVLLSNDENFSPEQTAVVGVQKSAAGEILDYSDIPEGKWRYLMVRTLDAESFGLTSVWALTEDVEPYRLIERNHEITISDNYITRAGSVYCSGGGICSYYGDRIRVLHNEISDIPYSAIMYGWGWLNTLHGTQDGEISYNHIKNATTVMHDGGGIYTLSLLEGTVAEGNFVDGVFIGRGSYYTDNGTASSIWRNNISQDSPLTYFSWEPSIRDNQYLSTYAEVPTNNNSGTNNVMDPLKLYLPGNMPPEAYAISVNAGPREEYRKIGELIPEDKLNVPDKRSILFNYGSAYQTELSDMLIYVVDAVLQHGEFGTLPGQYPCKYLYKLREAEQQLKNLDDGNRVETIMTVRALISELRESVNRLSYSEMRKTCEALADEAEQSGLYPAGAAKKMRALLDGMKDDDELTAAEEYSRLLTLEESYRELAIQKYTADIDFVYTEGVKDVIIDSNKHEVTLLMSPGADLTNKTLEVIPHGNAQVGAVYEDVDLNSELTIPMYCLGNKSYTMWKLKTQLEETKEWVSNITDVHVLRRGADGKLSLAPARAPYLLDADCTDRDIRFIPQKDDGAGSFCFLFGVSEAKGFVTGAHLAQNDYFELSVSGKNAVLNRIKEGRAQKMAEFAVPVSYGAENTIRVSSDISGTGYRMSIDFNGQRVAHLLTDCSADGLAGFYTETTTINLLD